MTLDEWLKIAEHVKWPIAIGIVSIVFILVVGAPLRLLPGGLRSRRFRWGDADAAGGQQQAGDRNGEDAGHGEHRCSVSCALDAITAATEPVGETVAHNRHPMIRLTHLLRATLAATLLAGCATTPKTPEQQAADKETAAAVKAALIADPNVYAEHVTVWADNGVVHLGGRVWSDWAMYEVQRVARSIPGVRKTVNEMDLPRESGDNSAFTE